MPALPPKSTSWSPTLTMLWYARPVGVLPPRGVSSFTVNLQRRSSARLSTTVGDSEARALALSSGDGCAGVSADPPACVEYHHLAVVDKVWFVGRRPVPAMQDDAVAIRWRPHHSHRSALQQMLRAPAIQCQSSYYHCQRTMLLHVDGRRDVAR